MSLLKPATPTSQRGCSLGAKDGSQAAVMVVADKSLVAGHCSLIPDSQLSSSHFITMDADVASVSKDCPKPQANAGVGSIEG